MRRVKEMINRDPIPNGAIVEVLGSYRCIGQICDHREDFTGRRYEVRVLESDLFDKGDIHTIVEDLLTPVKNYRPKND